MVARKTKRVAVVTAVSASLVMAGAAAFAHPNETHESCQWPGKGQGQGVPSPHDEHPGQGYYKGWPNRKCKDHDNNGGGNPGGPGGNPSGHPGGGPGGNPGGGTEGDNPNIFVDVTIQVGLPNVTAPDVAATVGDVRDHALSAVYQTVTLAESDVAGLMAIVEVAGEGATSLVNSSAQAGASVTGTSASGTLNVSSGAAGATTLGSDLAGSTLNLVKGNVTGAGFILGSMFSIL